MAGERGRLGGERLGRPCVFAAQGRGGHGFFLDRPERLAGDAIENKEVAVLGALGDGVDFFAAVRDGEQDRGARQVLVEEVVVNDLIVPEAFSGGRVEGDEGVGEEILAKAVGAVKIRFGGFRGHVDNSTGLVERLAGPRHRSGGGFIGVSRPGIVADFAWARNEVKNPAAGAGAHIKGADGAGTAEAADDEQITVGDAGGVEPDAMGAFGLGCETERDRAGGAEIRQGAAGRGI